jgi:hypothetical protein
MNSKMIQTCTIFNEIGAPLAPFEMEIG